MPKQSDHFHTIGQSYKAFKVTNILEIPELQATLRELVHTATGAQIMHIANDDTENLFCLSFKTLPYNSNGVAHILEHTVLCGSKKFPVKDPFFAMNRRSLNTFMNALTGSDFTCYPAASQVRKDFYNLLDVYLDAVFHPDLKFFSFLQEGHRLEFKQSDNSETALEYKGIVYNEMKGALSSASSRLSEAMSAALFPNITYGYNSGGDPKNIPQLTYDELKQFHQTYYHPSRCLFFFYGNMPLEQHLDFIEEQTLQHTKPLPALPKAQLQPRFHKPVYKEMTYPIASTEDLKAKSLISFAWLTCHILEEEDVLALSLLELVLMDTDASLLKKELLKSGLCKQATSFIDTEINEIPWGITLKGCEAEDADTLQTLIFETLKNLCHEGIPLQLIENAIHQLEFHRSEITGDHAPFGLSLFMRAGLLKQHGADPGEALKIHSLFEQIRQKVVAEPGYYLNLIQKHLIDNPHFVRIIMRPDPALDQQEIENENKKLAAIKEALSEKEKEAIVKQARDLAAFQKEQEDHEDDDVLPKVSLSDIPRGAKDFLLKRENEDSLTVFHHKVFTNNIVYADLVFDLPRLSEEEIPLLRLLTTVLNQLACGGRSYNENLDYIQGNTGGIGSGISLNLQANDHNSFLPTFHVRGKALQRKVPKLFELLYDTLTSVEFTDLKRFQEILWKEYTGMEGRLSQSALKYAINLSASCVNVPAKMAEMLYGLTYYWKIQELVQQFDQKGEKALADLKILYQRITAFKDPHLVLSCQQTAFDDLKGHQFYGLNRLQAAEAASWENKFLLTPLNPQGRIIASPVAFIGKVFETVSYTHPDAPALSIAAFLFDNLTLHTLIREQGGAYGGGASQSTSGNFYFYSYRDPNVVSTFDAFEIAVQEVIKGNFDDSDLEEAKLEMIQGLDSPVSPGSQGEIAYGWLREGRPVEIRQAYRNILLELTKEDVMQAVNAHIVPQMKKGVAMVFAGQELLEKANIELAARGEPLLEIKAI